MLAIMILPARDGHRKSSKLGSKLAAHVHIYLSHPYCTGFDTTAIIDKNENAQIDNVAMHAK